MEVRLALLFREVLEKCGTMSANAFIAVELSSGERLWAANGPFKEEFLNQVGCCMGPWASLLVSSSDVGGRCPRDIVHVTI